MIKSVATSKLAAKQLVLVSLYDKLYKKLPSNKLMKVKSKSEFNEFFIRIKKKYNKLYKNVDTADGGGAWLTGPPMATPL